MKFSNLLRVMMYLVKMVTILGVTKLFKLDT